MTFTFQHYPISGVNKDGEVTGFMGDFWNSLKASLGINNYSILSQKVYGGSADKDGNWNGLIGLAQRREIDFAVGAFYITKERKEVVDFTSPLLQSE